ncbi:LOW QUALITY PROTEIN: Mt_ATP-synt_B domain-containing protein, partial [Cephalotus follicularis]
KMLFADISSLCALSSKNISIYNEEMIVAQNKIPYNRNTGVPLGRTFKVILDERIQAIQEESQFPNPSEVVRESNEQQQLFRISLRICGTIVESLPMVCRASKCENIGQA